MLIKSVENFLIFVTIFVSSITFFTEPFEGYLHYFIFLLFLPFFIIRFGFPKMPFQLLFIPLLVGIFQIFIGNNTAALFLKIFIGVFLSTTFYYYVIQYYNLDVEKLFRLYMKGAIIVSIIGLFQVVSFKLGFERGYNYSWLFNKWAYTPSSFGIRLNSILPEPSQFAIVMAPACFVAVHNLVVRKDTFISRKQSWLLLIAMLLTSSSTGYIGIMFIGVFLTLNYGQFVNLLFAILALIVVGNVLYIYVPEFQTRVDTSVGLWVREDFSLKNMNSSSFVLYNNYHIASENFQRNILTGTGLGSHPIAYDKYSLTKKKGFLDFNFNKADGNSMFIRLLSETGLMGVVFIFLFIFKYYVRRSDDEDFSWIISNSLLIIIILYLMRQGNYFLNGFPFFMWMYYYNALARKEKLNAQVPENPEIEKTADTLSVH